MGTKNGCKPAPPGSLHANVLSDMLAAREFAAVRNRLMEELYEVKLPKSALRETLIHSVVIEHGCGEPRQLAYFVELCRPIAARSSVQREFGRLAALGLVTVIPGNAIVPTVELVDWFNAKMPVISAEGDRLFKRTLPQSV